MWAHRHNSASLSDTDSIPDNPASDGYDDYQLEEYNESEESVKGDGRLTAEQERDKLQILLSESTQEIKRLRELAAKKQMFNNWSSRWNWPVQTLDKPSG